MKIVVFSSSKQKVLNFSFYIHNFKAMYKSDTPFFLYTNWQPLVPFIPPYMTHEKMHSICF